MSDRERVIEAVAREFFAEYDTDTLLAALVDLLFADDPEPLFRQSRHDVGEHPAHIAWRHRADLKAAVLAAVGE